MFSQAGIFIFKKYILSGRKKNRDYKDKELW